jgi:hypothetical protein
LHILAIAKAWLGKRPKGGYAKNGITKRQLIWLEPGSGR